MNRKTGALQDSTTRVTITKCLTREEEGERKGEGPGVEKKDPGRAKHHPDAMCFFIYVSICIHMHPDVSICMHTVQQMFRDVEKC